MDLTEPPENLPISANLLDLRLNNIEILNELAFSGLSELASLHLDLNSIMTIRQGAFRGLKNLIYLYLSNNQIRKVYLNSAQLWFCQTRNKLVNLKDTWNQAVLTISFPYHICTWITTKLHIFPWVYFDQSQGYMIFSYRIIFWKIGSLVISVNPPACESSI